MTTFRDLFGASPDVSASAPGRVNLLGEHTDYNDGFVLPTAIPQRTTVEMRANGGSLFQVYSANLDARASFALDAPPTERFALYVYGCLREFVAQNGALPPLDIYLSSTVPIGAGLSSSAALEVAVLRALRIFTDVALDDTALAGMAQQAEIRYAGVHCGIMDQMAASLADESHMLFLDCRSLEYRLLPLPEASEIAVIHSGIDRTLAASAYNERRGECAEAARRLGVAALRDIQAVEGLASLPEPLLRRARHVVSENQRVRRAAEERDPARFGALMNASHASLRDDFEVSTPRLDKLVQLLQEDGEVYGARLTGAGFGGACVALCRPGTARTVAQRALSRYNDASARGRLLVPA